MCLEMNTGGTAKLIRRTTPSREKGTGASQGQHVF